MPQLECLFPTVARLFYQKLAGQTTLSRVLKKRYGVSTFAALSDPQREDLLAYLSSL